MLRAIRCLTTVEGPVKVRMQVLIKAFGRKDIIHALSLDGQHVLTLISYSQWICSTYALVFCTKNVIGTVICMTIMYCVAPL